MGYANRPIRPVSLQQFAFYGRKLTDEKIIHSANFVRQELPTRMAHRIHDMQRLPYSIIRNPHMSHVYELYYHSFNSLRKFPKIRSLDDNDKLCNLVKDLLLRHTEVVPRVVMGVIESAELMDSNRLDRFIYSLLSSRISRRVLTEQHLTMTNSLKEGNVTNTGENVGQVFLQLHAADVVRQCADLAGRLVSDVHRGCATPEIIFEGDSDTKFAFIESHFKYMLGEILRNAFEAAASKTERTGEPLKPLLVTVCNTPHQLIFRFSDRAGGIPSDVVQDLWSFAKGPRSLLRHEKLEQLPFFDAVAGERESINKRMSSLSSLTSRPSDLFLGMGLPMSKVYAEFWGGKIVVKSMEGFGCDVFLHISKLGIESAFVENTSI